MKRMLFTLMAATALVPAMAHAVETDTEFVRKAAIGSMFEVQSSQIALERSQSQHVKTFAAMMIKDHEKASADLKAAVGKAGNTSLTIPTELDEAHTRKLNDLREADAKDFDDKYIDIQDDAHDDALDLFEDYSKGAGNVVLKEFATKTLPTLRAHEDHIEKIDDNDDGASRPAAKP